MDIERLVGTAFDDTLIGDSADNTLHGEDGNDTLLGGEGNDTLLGGSGIDYFDGGEGSDTVDFSTGEFAIIGDLIQSRATYINDAGVEVVETWLNIENLVGTAFDDQLIGDAADNTLHGENGNDTLLGNEGNDHLIGGGGIDYFDGGEGRDTVDFSTGEFAVIGDLSQSRATYINDAGVEVVETLLNIERLVGTAFDDQLIGDAENNSLTGAGGNDILIGCTGNDRLYGGTGADIFGFSSPNQGIDTITDFNSTQGDLIQISANDFGGGLTLGTLDIDQFTIGSAATRASDRLIYNDTTGALFFDPDGTGTLAQVQLAQLSGGVALSNNDIFVV
ncbi:MAG: calcium-binding protein [Symploca sp. SIO3E6]|nr:calcium-binding protein [Caldora sp. SIO3E6]